MMKNTTQIAFQLREGKNPSTINEIISQWPGDETDEQFDEMLKELLS